MTRFEPAAPVRYGFDGPSTTTLLGVVRWWAERTPDAPAILAPGRLPLTYRALLEQIERSVRALNDAGLGRNDRVALALPDGPELAVAILAVGSAATAAPLNPDSPVDDLGARVVGLRPDAIVVLADTEGGPRRAAGDVPVVDLVPTPAAAGAFALRGDLGRRPDRDGFAGPEDVAYLLHTSSTTGSPKRVPRSHRMVCEVARTGAIWFALGPADRCLNVASMVHSQGVNSLLAALTAGGSMVCTGGYDPARVFAWIEEFSPTWTATVPPVLRSLLEQIEEAPERRGQHRFRFVRSSAAPAAAGLLADLEAALGVPVIDAYGMTEAQQIASSPLPPLPRKPGSAGLPLGPEIRIQDDAGTALPPGEAGEVVVRGPSVFAGYDGDPAATAAAFTADGWFRTGDVGYLDEDGYLFVTGRLSDIINRGGEKVAPREVEAALLAHKGVAQAAVFPVSDERLGHAVAAAVVPCDGCRLDEVALRRFVAARLAPARVPRRIVVVEAIPTGPNGKVQRRALAALLGVAPAAAARGTGDGSRSPVGRLAEGAMETAVAETWAAVLGLGEIGAEEEFLALGGDSIQAARIIARLRDTLRLDLSVAMFFEAGTVAAMAGVLEDLLLRQEDERVPVAARSGSEPAARPSGPTSEVSGVE